MHIKKLGLSWVVHINMISPRFNEAQPKYYKFGIAVHRFAKVMCLCGAVFIHTAALHEYGVEIWT